MVTNRELIDAALDSLHPLRRDDGVKFGNVSAAVASSSGRIYQGVNLFTPAGAAQICAEKMAYGAMATAGEFEAAKVVAVWRPTDSHDAHVVPPCGWCREFIAQLAPAGHETIVVLGEQGQRARQPAAAPKHRSATANDGDVVRCDRAGQCCCLSAQPEG